MRVRATITQVYEFDLDPTDFDVPGDEPMTEDEAFEALRASVEDDNDFDFLESDCSSMDAKLEKIG